jgi:hypothetical protein
MQLNLEPSPIATPTRENTATYLDKGTKQEHEDLFKTNACLNSHFFFHYFHFNDKHSRWYCTMAIDVQ